MGVGRDAEQELVAVGLLRVDRGEPELVDRVSDGLSQLGADLVPGTRGL
jgi:hypothetical protein